MLEINGRDKIPIRAAAKELPFPPNAVVVVYKLTIFDISQPIS